ncbi:hypothetical protein NDN08_006688 [Rhodosorus marinus]|uniref:Cyclin n=1 Tax=Rhodosorus marinus TaxID=101924 RepID=A0AAV8ULE9_9RHOD|nr:hypothetical protein NDN08_006688 [Rhodosorus marinus]
MEDVRGVSLHELEDFESVLTAGVLAWVRKSERRPRLRVFSSECHGKRLPPIKLEDYVARIMKYSNCSPVCFSVAIALMRRLASKFDEMIPINLNVHRLLLACVVLAIKMMEDRHFDNLHFSKVGGLGLVELNILEMDLLKRLNFDLRMDPEELQEAEAFLLSEVMSCNVNLGTRERAVLRNYGLVGKDEFHRKRPVSPSMEREATSKVGADEAFPDAVRVFVH